MTTPAYSLTLMILLFAACTSSPSTSSSNSPNDEADRSATEKSFKYFGLLRYDLGQATLLGCHGEVYLLQGKMFDGAIEEIIRLKADPKYRVWIQVTTPNEVNAGKEGGPIPLEVGELGRTLVDPCPAK
jgi:predicted component of type VI protein secretion system